MCNQNAFEISYNFFWIDGVVQLGLVLDTPRSERLPNPTLRVFGKSLVRYYY